MNEQLEQRVARAIADQEDANDHKRDPGCARLEPYDDMPEHWKEDYRLIAQAALKAHEEWLEARAGGGAEGADRGHDRGRRMGDVPHRWRDDNDIWRPVLQSHAERSI